MLLTKQHLGTCYLGHIVSLQYIHDEQLERVDRKSVFIKVQIIRNLFIFRQRISEVSACQPNILNFEAFCKDVYFVDSSVYLLELLPFDVFDLVKRVVIRSYVFEQFLDLRVELRIERLGR